MIEPTPCRMVWYHPAGADPAALPHAAMVVGVHNERCVNLAIFDAEGHLYHGTEVLLLQDGDTRPERAYAEWMPYQKGQSAKTEADTAATVDLAPLQAKVAGVETGVNAKLQELGDWIVKKFAEVEGRIAALAPSAAPPGFVHAASAADTTGSAAPQAAS